MCATSYVPRLDFSNLLLILDGVQKQVFAHLCASSGETKIRLWRGVSLQHEDPKGFSRAHRPARGEGVLSRHKHTGKDPPAMTLTVCVCLLAARAAYTEKAKIKTPKHSGRPHHSLIIHDMDSRRGSEITARASVSNQAFSTQQSVRLLGKFNKRGRLAFCTLRRVFSPRTAPVL